LIFDSVFVESLHLVKGASEGTRRLVEEFVASKKKPMEAKDLARKLRISMAQAYAKLRSAESAGVIQRANKPGPGNRKFFLPAPRPRFVPDPEELFRKLKNVDGPVRFIHPITGETVVYRRE
jgi:predicted transcriptional regulator